MRNLFGILSVFLFSLSFAQVGSSPYKETNTVNSSSNSQSSSFFSSGTDAAGQTPASTERIGNPDAVAEPNAVPVDGYIPLLVVVAVGFIIYYQARRKLTA